MISTSEVISYLKEELGSYFSTEAHPDPYRYVNSAINFIYNYRDWQFLREEYTVNYTVANSIVTIPFNVKTYFVSSSDNPEIDILSKEEYFKGYEGVMVVGNQFRSRATGTYEIMYMPAYTKVTADTQFIDLPENFEDVVKSLAVHFGMKKIRDYDTANQVLAFAKAIMDPITERATNTRPRKKARAGSRHNIF